LEVQFQFAKIHPLELLAHNQVSFEITLIAIDSKRLHSNFSSDALGLLIQPAEEASFLPIPLVLYIPFEKNSAPVEKSNRMIQEIEDREFDEIVEKATAPVLVEFWQPGCGHCQALLQELEHLQAEVGDRLAIYKMNVQENFLIPGELEIHSLPTLALYVDGKFEKFLGGIGKKFHLLQQLAPWLSPPT
jgi:thiol-disulfide isomerase/thioredoxin